MTLTLELWAPLVPEMQTSLGINSSLSFQNFFEKGGS